jgi:hypothetical protein
MSIVPEGIPCNVITAPQNLKRSKVWMSKNDYNTLRSQCSPAKTGLQPREQHEQASEKIARRITGPKDFYSLQNINTSEKIFFI